MFGLNTVIISFLVTFTESFHLPGTKTNTGCVAMDNKAGHCVAISECRTVENILGQQTTKEKLKFLAKFSCGFTNNNPKICCPLDITLTGRNSDPVPTTEKVSNEFTTPSTTTQRFRLVEETTKPNKIKSRTNDNDLRVGFSEWGVKVKCTSEFCDEAFN